MFSVKVQIRAATVVMLAVCAGLHPLLSRAQEQAPSTDPFFAVSSGQTYAPGNDASIQLQFRQIDRLDFRAAADLYKEGCRR